MDMQTGDYYAGSPEAVKAIRAGVSMASPASVVAP